MAEYRTRETEQGTEIQVRAENEVALVVREGDDERIFLPPFNAEQDTYYVEPTDEVVETEEGYRIVYPGEPTSIELFSR
jgi:hypothetical protein